MWKPQVFKTNLMPPFQPHAFLPAYLLPCFCLEWPVLYSAASESLCISRALRKPHSRMSCALHVLLPSAESLSLHPSSSAVVDESVCTAGLSLWRSWTRLPSSLALLSPARGLAANTGAPANAWWVNAGQVQSGCSEPTDWAQSLKYN